jgi:hypothetical protein
MKAYECPTTPTFDRRMSRIRKTSGKHCKKVHAIRAARVIPIGRMYDRLADHPLSLDDEMTM